MNFLRYIMSLFTRRNTNVEPIKNVEKIEDTLDKKIDLVLFTYTTEKIDKMVKEHNYYNYDKMRISPYWSIYDKVFYLVKEYMEDPSNFVYYDLRFLFVIRPKELANIKRLQVF